MMTNKTALLMTQELGARLKQARLNKNLTQLEVATLAGVARKTVINAEKGKVQLEVFVALMLALGVAEQLAVFLPKPDISPLQLAKLQGKKRQRASSKTNSEVRENSTTW